MRLIFVAALCAASILVGACAHTPRKQPELCHRDSQGLVICKDKKPPREFKNPNETYHDLDID